MRCVICDYETTGLSVSHDVGIKEAPREMRYLEAIGQYICSECDTTDVEGIWEDGYDDFFDAEYEDDDYDEDYFPF